jgi:hypothetical protein
VLNARVRARAARRGRTRRRTRGGASGGADRLAQGSRTTWIKAGGAIAHAEALRMQTQALIDRDAEAYHETSLVLAHDERSVRRGVASPDGTAALPSGNRERIVDEALVQAADLALAIAGGASEMPSSDRQGRAP